MRCQAIEAEQMVSTSSQGQPYHCPVLLGKWVAPVSTFPFPLVCPTTHRILDACRLRT
jgi:hypothetical protein